MNRAQRRALARQGGASALPHRAAPAISIAAPAADPATLLGEGVALHQQGDLPAAEARYRAVLELDPDNPDALHLLGLLARQVGRNDVAVELIGAAIARNPKNPTYHSNLGNALRALGRHEKAVASYRRALDLAPELVEALNNLGNALVDRGSSDEAIACFEKACALAPKSAAVHNNLGTALRTRSRPTEALAAFRRAIELAPDYAEAHSNLGSALQDLGNLDAAVASYRRAIALQPRLAEAHSNLGAALHALGHPDEALASHERALALQPSRAIAWNSFGNALRDLGRLSEAVVAYEQASALEPSYASAHANRCAALRKLGRLEEAATSAEQALALQPDLANAHNNLAGAIKDQGRLDEALASYRRALELRPDDPTIHSNLLMTMHYHTAADRPTLLAEARRWAERHAGKLTHECHPAPHHCHPEPRLCHPEPSPCHPERSEGSHAPHQGDSGHHEILRSAQDDTTDQHHMRRAPGETSASSDTRGTIRASALDRRLRLGFVSPDLHRHPVGFLLQAVAPALDRSRVETIFYADGTRSDDVTERLRASADRWRPIDGLADAAVAELIRRDEIDVLVDLAGHTANNRLLVFAHRPAPIQATWLGFFGTTGLPAIDYLIADPIVCPPDHDRDYVERILRLPDSFACYAPPVVDVAVTPPPALDRGQVTFGCFNNLAKVTPATLALWVAVLEAVPSSRLLLKAAPLADPGTVARLRNRFADLGIDPVRLELVGRSANADYLSAYGDVDVALDPIPFTGGMTSLDALWMGVPVVTLAGDRFAARMSASFLHTLGLPELVATTPEAYVAIAAGLASDLGRLPELRTTLRPRMAASPLCDARGFAGAFEQALRQAWHAR